jgi:hypothetical protein
MTDVSTVQVSFVLPYFKKFSDLTRALPHNGSHFAHPSREVVLSMDEPSEADDVLKLVHATESQIHWRVLINDTHHAWRAPSKALNVGIRNALGQLVVVSSPESVFVDDPLTFAPEVINQEAFVVGRVAFATYDEFALRESMGLAHVFEVAENSISVRMFYGSLLARRASFEAVTGYDERLEKWGGDDDNLRARFGQVGLRMIRHPDLRVIHLSTQPRRGISLPPESFPSDRIITPDDERELLSPSYAKPNPPSWGSDYDRVLYDWAVEANSRDPE